MKCKIAMNSAASRLTRVALAALSMGGSVGGAVTSGCSSAPERDRWGYEMPGAAELAGGDGGSTIDEESARVTSGDPTDSEDAGVATEGFDTTAPAEEPNDEGEEEAVDGEPEPVDEVDGGPVPEPPVDPPPGAPPTPAPPMDSDACPGVPVSLVGTTLETTISASSTAFTNRIEAACSLASGGSEGVFRLVAPITGRVTVTMRSLAFAPMVHVGMGDCAAVTTIACDASTLAGLPATTTFYAVSGSTYYVFADQSLGLTDGTFTLTIAYE